MIYQPIHVVIHHGEYHEHGNYGERNLSQDHDKCLTYEYQIASFDLPEKNHFEVLKFTPRSALSTLNSRTYYGMRVNNSSPRAPPVYLSYNFC